MGLGANEAAAARDQLAALDIETRLDLFAAAFETFDDLWDAERRAESIAAVWVARFGRAIAIADDVVADAKGELSAALAMPTLDALRTVVAPSALDERGFQHALSAIAHLAPWIVAYRPAGDPLRAAVPAALEWIRAGLREPERILDLGTVELSGDDADARAEHLTLAVGGEPVSGGGRDNGRVVAERLPYALNFRFRPAQMRDEADFATARKLVADRPEPVFFDASIVAGDRLATFARRAVDTPLANGASAFRDLRTGRSVEGWTIGKPSTVMSTAEAVSVATSLGLSAAYFGDERDAVSALPGHLLGAVTKDDAADRGRLLAYWDAADRGRLLAYWDTAIKRRADTSSARLWKRLHALRTTLT